MDQAKFVPGTPVILQPGTGHTCMLAGHRTTVQQDADGLFVTCLDGPHHFTHGDEPFDTLWLDFEPA